MSEAAAAEPFLLVDPDTYTAGLLATLLCELGPGEPVVVHNGLDASSALARQRFGALVFNFHFDQPDMLACCAAARLADASLPVVVITAPGPALAEVRRWQKDSGAIDAIIEKPLRDNRLRQALNELVTARQAKRRTERLTRMIPAEAVVADAAAKGPEMREQAILFTDLRRSTQLAVTLGPHALFELLNATLSAQAAVVRRNGGTVIKYTGDGLMAAFRGSGKNHLALRCALALQPLASRADLPFGIGLASGLTIVGFIGEAEQRHYDVIGATVHLAARLCALAGPGEVLTTAETGGHTALAPERRSDLGRVEVRGFDAGVPCFAFASTPSI